MPDIIQLLPDSIANQIAAGEVIQRPASVVKELMENALDAGSTQIKLIIKDSGKTSIQVIDDGKGMSETDARMAFERHATSKISSANDLFCIKTMGFRGEAMASIAAIAHVEMITKQHHEDVGHKIIIEGSVVTKTEKVQAFSGTSVTVKNLFYNVPARRKFLKSDPVELKHILDEFHRVCLANPEVHFTFHHNGNEVYHLPKGNLKQRIVGVLGKQYNDKLVPINEETEVANFSGFIGKPEAAKKTQGEQYIFVNNRFIKSHYLNHAIRSAYDELITKEVFPSYFLFLDVDPANIDINVHPTKTEIKFEDERLIYNYLRVTLKHSLGQYSVSPMLDFNTDHNFASRHSHIASPDQEKVHYKSGQKSMYFPENEERFKPGNQKSTGWEDIYKGMQQFSIPENTDGKIEVETLESEAFRLTGNDEMGMKIKEQKEPYQIHNQYVLHQVKSGLMVIDYQAAHERILYERYLDYLKNGKSSTQKELFPRTVELDPAKGEVLKNILQKVNNLGFEMEDFGHHTFIIHGTPSGLDANTDLHQLIQQLIQNYIENIEFELGVEDNLARSMAISSGLKKGKRLEKEEMISLIDQLFGCEMPYKSPSGKKTYVIIEHDELFKRFSN